MEQNVRYIVWRDEEKDSSGDSVRAILTPFHTVKIVKYEDPDYAVVYMDVGTAMILRHMFPGLLIEQDVQYHMTSLR